MGKEHAGLARRRHESASRRRPSITQIGPTSVSLCLYIFVFLAYRSIFVFLPALFWCVWAPPELLRTTKMTTARLSSKSFEEDNKPTESSSKSCSKSIVATFFCHSNGGFDQSPTPRRRALLLRYNQLHYSILYYSILHCTMLSYNILYYTAL